jgi:L-ornithine Nalpha-acyltransferase
VASIIHREAVRLSRQEGITHWIACGTIETNVPAEAAQIAAIAESLGLVHKDVWITPRQTFCPVNENSALVGSNGCRLPSSMPSNGKLPRILAMYTRHLAARIIGPPLYDPRFRGYSIPILMEVAEQRFADRRPLAPTTLPSPIAA